MTGRGGNADWSCDVLERIVALLFGLADLADLAARAPFHRRRQALLFLGRGEAAARAFLIGTAACGPAPVNAPATVGDAVRLAARLRALALLLCVLLARPPALASATISRAGRQRPAEPPDAPLPPDTS